MHKGILFLGTAGDHVVWGKQQRASGGILITTDENQLHLNPGPGSLLKYKELGINVRETTIVCNASQQVIDANDTNAIIEAMTLNGLDKKGILVTCNAAYELVSEYHKGLVERHIKLEPGMRVGINDIELRSCSTTDDESSGFIFYTTEFVLGYVGTTNYKDALVHHFKDVHILIVNCKNSDNIEEKNQMNLADAKKLIAGVKPNLAILTYFGQKMLSLDIIDEARNIQKETGITTISATDGLFINPKQYNKGFKQQALSGYK